MVQTRASAKRTKPEKGPPQDSAISSPPAKKRQRDDAKSSRKGKRRELCQLNLDVLFLIAGYVHPLDLLNLARTCKSLRQLLMDVASAFIWKTARRQVSGLPDCPADLTEPEYANLLFHARCYGCGKYAKWVLWAMRRRYCPDCRGKQLRSFSSCPDIIRQNYVLPGEFFAIDGEQATWVDQEQVNSFLQDYDDSSDKAQFLHDKQNQYSTVLQHANLCWHWERSRRRVGLEFRRWERDRSIFNRLKEHGYQPEIEYFEHDVIRQSCKSAFKTSKPLTDKEWTRMWPEWLRIMNNFRSQRINKTVYQPRRDLLQTEYNDYLTFPSPNAPVLDLLPRATELECFPPFRDVIRAPEGTQMGDKPFESALSQLPALVNEWRRPLDVELAKLVRIPSDLSRKGTSSGQAVLSNNTKHMKSNQTTTDKLHLACAVFSTTGSRAVLTHPEVFSHSMRLRPAVYEDDQHTLSFGDRFGITFLEDAPYIVHACGLDPNVATAEDMDRRNARLRCLSCKTPYVRVRCWKEALYHALFEHRSGKTSHSTSSRWQLISDEYIYAIQAAELPIKREFPTAWARCLLCRPSVGDAMLCHETMDHLVQCHDMERHAIEDGVHYIRVGMTEPCAMVVMVEERGQVSFENDFDTIS